MSDYDGTRDFLIDLGDFPDLPAAQRGEWVEMVHSPWIDGVFFNDRQDPNCTVALQRVANNEEGYNETVLDYEVTVNFGPNPHDMNSLLMSPQAAIDLGHHLIAAGTTAMRDFGKHAWFLAGNQAVTS